MVSPLESNGCWQRPDHRHYCGTDCFEDSCHDTHGGTWHAHANIQCVHVDTLIDIVCYFVYLFRLYVYTGDTQRYGAPCTNPTTPLCPSSINYDTMTTARGKNHSLQSEQRKTDGSRLDLLELFSIHDTRGKSNNIQEKGKDFTLVGNVNGVPLFFCL